MDTMVINYNLSQLNDDIKNLTDTLVKLSHHSEMVTEISISINSVQVLTAQLDAMIKIVNKELHKQDEKLSKEENEFYKNEYHNA